MSTDTEVAGRLESLQVKTTGIALAATVGVPVTTPVLAFRLKPAGSVPLLIVQLSGDVPPCTKVLRS
jgi:hypothetical protein